MDIMIKEISDRYDGLAESCCSLSCGKAIDFTNPKEGNICLDLGSGRGGDVMNLAEKVGDTGYVFGMDGSLQMIETARKNAEKFGFTNVEFIHGELNRIPLPNDTVDYVISNCTINHVQDKQLLWNDIYRVLSPDGRFVVSDIFATTKVPEEYSQDPKAVAACWGGAVTKYEYLMHLSLAGFADIEILEESAPYEKGKIQVVSMTITGKKRNLEKKSGNCGCGGCSCGS